MSDNGQRAPLIERLRRVPAIARVLEHTPNPLGYDTASIPVGALCREAADRIAELEADLERERMRIAACGVVAGANTRDSAAKVRQISPEYRSALLDDVERAVDREIAERERREAAEAELAAERALAEVKARNVTAHERIAKLDCALLDMRRELAGVRALELQRGNALGRIAVALLGNQNNVSDDAVVAAAERVAGELAAVREVVNAQAEDDGLWFVASTAPEAYLQQELRRLHAVIEGDAARAAQMDGGERGGDDTALTLAN